MYKTILAVSEGGPDAAMAFSLAARLALTFEAVVDAVHFTEIPDEEIDIASQAMPFLRSLTEGRQRSRRAESERCFRDLVRPVAGSTFTGDGELERDDVVAMGRYADLLVLGRPGSDSENISPATVRAALFECARPVVVAPPRLRETPIASVVLAWNGSQQSARALGYALPFLERARAVTVVVAGSKPEKVGAALVLRTLERHGVAATLDTLEHGETSGRARGRALIGYAKDRDADLLVMGAYGHGGLSNFLGLGGATAKVISSCPVPLLLAH